MEYHQQTQFVSDDYVPPLRDTEKLHGSVTSQTSEEPKILKSKSQKKGDPGVRFCEYCGKKFECGKALGGHIRSHKNKNKKFNGTPIRVGDLLSDGKPTCCICGKDFKSMKSLFGHMKCHPEREWRGTQPPWSDKNSSCSVEDEELDDNHHQISTSTAPETDEFAVDPLKVLSNWSRTDKRGRRSISGERVPETAARGLMKLARGESGLLEESEAKNNNYNCLPDDKAKVQGKNYVVPLKKRIIQDSQVGNQSKYPSKKLKIDGTAGSWISKSKTTKVTDHKGMGKNLVENGSNKESAGSADCEWGDSDWPRKYMKIKEEFDSEKTESGIVGQPLNPEIGKMTAKKKQKKVNTNWNIKLEDVERQKQVSTRTPGMFECSTCFKCFSTYQALGGHRSSHNKEKNTQRPVDESTPEDDASAVEKKGYTRSPNLVDAKEGCEENGSMAVGTTYRCKICNKTFQTGQALGGHKRSHWAAPVLEAPSSQVASVGEASQSDPKIASPGEASQSGPKVVLNFDLNEFPPMEDEGIESGFNQVS